MSDLPQHLGPQVAGELTKHAMEAVTSLSGSMAEEVKLWLGEEVRAIRFRRTLKLFESARRKVADAGLKLNPVKAKILLPLIEAASLEEDEGQEAEEMHERWANMLSNASNEPEDVPPAFPEILKQMTSADAKYFEEICNTRPPAPLRLSRANIGSLHFTRIGGAQRTFARSLENLERLMLVERVPTMTIPWKEIRGSTSGSHGGIALPRSDQHIQFVYGVTETGWAFHKACQPPAKREEKDEPLQAL